MFTTLGNLAVDDTAALLIVDFERGSALQLSGRVTLEWVAPGTGGEVQPSPVNPPIAPG